MYVTPREYDEIIDNLERKGYTDYGWANNYDFIKPALHLQFVMTYYDGQGLNLTIDHDQELFYQTDSSD